MKDKIIINLIDQVREGIEYAFKNNSSLKDDSEIKTLLLTIQDKLISLKETQGLEEIRNTLSPYKHSRNNIINSELIWDEEIKVMGEPRTLDEVLSKLDNYAWDSILKEAKDVV